MSLSDRPVCARAKRYRVYEQQLVVAGLSTGLLQSTIAGLSAQDREVMAGCVLQRPAKDGWRILRQSQTT